MQFPLCKNTIWMSWCPSKHRNKSSLVLLTWIKKNLFPPYSTFVKCAVTLTAPQSTLKLGFYEKGTTMEYLQPEQQIIFEIDVFKRVSVKTNSAVARCIWALSVLTERGFRWPTVSFFSQKVMKKKADCWNLIRKPWFANLLVGQNRNSTKDCLFLNMDTNVLYHYSA